MPECPGMMPLSMIARRISGLTAASAESTITIGKKMAIILR